MAKVLVSLDDDLLREVDRVADKRGLTRSAYLAGLARSDLARVKGPGAAPEVHAALARAKELLKDTPPGDSTAIIREMRDSR